MGLGRAWDFSCTSGDACVGLLPEPLALNENSNKVATLKYLSTLLEREASCKKKKDLNMKDTLF